MNRNQSNPLINDSDRPRTNLPYARSSLIQHIKTKWLSTAIGLIGLISSLVLIIGNEAKAVKISKVLENTISSVVTVAPESDIDKSHIGKLIYITGFMSIHEPLTEVDYGISVMAVKLLRQVQMYQWVESEHDTIDGDGNTISSSYNYYKEWQNYLIDSSGFHYSSSHRNPKEFPIKRLTQINDNVKIGKYNLGLELKKKFKDFVAITSDERPERKDIKLHSGMYYHCDNIWEPQIGDVRIQFFYAGHHDQIVTIVARLDDTLTLLPYIYDNKEILFLKIGSYSLEEMFAIAHSHNKFQTWMFRVAGWFLLYLSCMSLGTFLQIILTYSEFLQEILPLTHSSMKMTVSMCLSLLFTALSWVWYRPILGVGMIFVTIPLLFLIKFFSNPGTVQHYNRL